jgi:hypothetical protein
MTASAPPAPDRPWVFLGEEGERADALAHSGDPLPLTSDLNALSAVSAARLALALVPGAPPARLSAPGPLGLPGGAPVRISEGKVTLDLPPGLSPRELAAAQWRWARGDGLEGLDQEGRLHFTEQARAALQPVDPALAEPLALGEAPARWRLLASHLGLAAAAA